LRTHGLVSTLILAIGDGAVVAVTRRCPEPVVVTLFVDEILFAGDAVYEYRMSNEIVDLIR